MSHGASIFSRGRTGKVSGASILSQGRLYRAFAVLVERLIIMLRFTSKAVRRVFHRNRVN